LDKEKDIESKNGKIMDQSIKATYIFTLVIIFFIFVSLLVTFSLPWRFQENFFEICEGSIGLMIFFICIILLLIISFLFNEKKLFPQKLNWKTMISSIPFVWLLILCVYLFLSVLVGLSTVGYEKGIGYVLFNYLLLGEADLIIIPNIPYNVSFMFNVFVICFPFIIFILGTVNVKLKIEKNWTRKKIIQMIEWILCIGLNSGVLVGILISFFFPWSGYENFAVFLVSNFNGQNAWFLISLIIGIILTVIAMILILSSIFTKKPWNRQSEIFIDQKIGIIKRHTLKTVLYWWFICWMGIWISLSISIAGGLFLIEEGILVTNSGFLLYLYTAHFMVRISIIMGMVGVVYHGSKYPAR
jgi:hypothetical protein